MRPVFFKKYLGKEFIFIVANTATACILFIIFYVRKDSVVLTRTFSYIVVNPINEQEIAEFIDNFEAPHKVKIRLKDIVNVSYQQKFSFELKFYDVKSDDELAEKLKKEFEFFFQIKLITKALLKDKKFPQVIYDIKAGAFIVVNINENKLKVPAIISLLSTSTSAEGLKVFNAYRVENAELLELSENLRILTLGKKNKDNVERGVSLLSIQVGGQYLFFEVIEIK